MESPPDEIANLRESEHRYRMLVEHAPDAILVHQEGRIVLINNAGVRLFGAGAAADLIGRCVLDFVHPDYLACVRQRIEGVIQEGQAAPLIAEKWVRLDGAVVDVEVAGTPCTFAGRPAVQVVARDVTQQRQAEAARRESEALFESLIESLPFDVWARDMQDRCIAQNTTARLHWGDQRNRLLEDIPMPADILALWREHNRLARAGQHVRCEIRYVEGSEPRWYDKILSPIRDDGVIRGTVGVNIDITERKAAEEERRRAFELLEARVAERTAELRAANDQLSREVAERVRAEAQLREQENRLHAIINNTTAVIYLKDLAGRYILINRRYGELFHVDQANVAGKTDFDLFPPPTAAAFQANDRRVIEANRALEFEETAPHDDGVHTYISIKFPLHDGGGRVDGVCGISTDITERLRAAEEVRRHQEQLAHAGRLAVAGQLAALMAHELSQPLNAIANYAQGCLNYLQSGAVEIETIRKRLGTIVAQAGRVGLFVARVREFVKNSPSARDEFALGDVVRAALEVVGPRLQDTQTRLTVDLENPGPVVVADAIQIEHVLINLLLNGMEAMLHLPPVERQMVVGTRSDGGQAEIFVRDSGTGVPMEMSSAIFQHFPSEKPNGLGMGLSIARGIMKAHAGSLTFRNNDDRGATFFARLPAIIRQP